MEKSVIFASGGGRLGNQLNNYSFLLSFKLEYPEFDVVTLPILPYLNDYDRPDLPLANIKINDGIFGKLMSTFYPRKIPLLNSENSKVFKVSNIVGPRILHLMAVARNDAQSLVTFNHLPGKEYDKIDLTEEINTLRQKSVTVISGYIQQPTKLISKYMSEIRNQMQPGPKYSKRVDRFINTLRQNYDCLVGVHIRQGDYKYFKGGKYYLSSREYLQIINQFENIFPNKSIAFVIASTDYQNSELFNKSNYYTELGGNQIKHYMEDFIKLINCDIILGPPSTFSQWAAFLGEIPKVPLYKNVTSDKFQLINEPLITDVGEKITKLS